MFYVIVDKVDYGFAMNNPIEGWVFTTLYDAAERFSTRRLAEQAIKDHYKNSDRRDDLVVMSEEQVRQWFRELEAARKRAAENPWIEPVNAKLRELTDGANFSAVTNGGWMDMGNGCWVTALAKMPEDRAKPPTLCMAHYVVADGRLIFYPAAGAYDVKV